LNVIASTNPLIVQDDVDEPRHRAADSVICRPFAGDDVIGGPSHLLVDLLPVLRPERRSMDLHKVVEAHAGDRDLRPGEHLGIPVLAEDVGVDMLRVHVEVPPEQGAEPGGVEHRAGAEDARGGYTGYRGEMRRPGAS
jgi:hypothetical protein